MKTVLKLDSAAKQKVFAFEVQMAKEICYPFPACMGLWRIKIVISITRNNNIPMEDLELKVILKMILLWLNITVRIAVLHKMPT